MMKDIIYLDYAAATPVDEQVLSVMLPYMSGQFYNPSATYLAAKESAQAVAEARGKVARCLGARQSEVIFTSGATESNNLAIHGVMRKFPDGNIIVTAIEHDSVLGPAGNYDCRQAAVREDGLVDLAALAGLIDDKTVLVSVMYANNEIGTIQPLKQIAELIKEHRMRRQEEANDRPLYLHTDAAQAANYLDLHVARLGVDLMSLNGGKIYGPKGSGVLYARTGVDLQPQIGGGGQERGLRSGTENVPGIVGFAVALESAQALRHQETKRLQQLQRQLISSLRQSYPTAVINGSEKHRLPNNVHCTFLGSDNERLMMSLDERGILCAAGSACSASKEESSHVLKALGKNDSEARSSLRFSMGRNTSEADLNRLLSALHEII